LDDVLEGYTGPVPRHIAVIMDGNGRWAQLRGEERTAGHRAGAKTVRAITRACAKLGVEVLTLYSFSTENWGRPKIEVDALMALLTDYLENEADELLANRIRLRAIGELDSLPAGVRMLLDQVGQVTADEHRMDLVLALSYGSRQEIIRTIRTLSERVAAGTLKASDIDEAMVSESLDTSFAPDPDLIIRTSGEFRLSNFLLWQAAYAEMYVTDVLWPDFDEAELVRALKVFERRQRRFGKTAEQLAETP
jgi:undecaprenyl diphosphate synthase